MPDAEQRAGHGRQWREVRTRQGRAQAGVLHADFQGQGLALGQRQFEQASGEVTQQVTEAVVQHHHGHDQQAGFGDLRLAGGNDGRDDDHDAHHRHQRQHIHRMAHPVTQHTLGDDAEHDRQEHHLQDRPEQLHE
ncbi:hypothetical protein D3C73_1300250 [compost metagenome]